MPMGAQLLIAVLVAALLGGGGWYLVVKPMQDTNAANQKLLQSKLDDNAKLRQFETNLPGLEREIASLQQQLEIQKTIVPDKKEAPEFMHLMQDTAASAGIQIRSYNSQPAVTKQYYTEVPYQMELDGPYFSLVNFFEKVAKLQRIINVTNLQVANLKHAGDAKAKGGYDYAPGESVVASCTTTTFFSHDAAESAPAKGAAAGGKK
jgi:type IV pilus assembly protein PilO